MSEENKEIKEEVQIINDGSMKRVYSNYISVAKALNEFNLTFCCVDPLDDRGAQTVAKVAIPNSIVENFIKEMTEEFKNPKKPSPKFYIGISKHPVY
jgi:hypothetical protein